MQKHQQDISGFLQSMDAFTDILPTGYTNFETRLL